MTDTAIPAATIVVMRDGRGERPQVLAVTRGRDMAFAGGALAFPGGRIDEADRELAKTFSDPHAAWKLAAIRELIEETGVAVALDPLPSEALVAEAQRRLHQGEEFAELLRQFALSPILDALIPFTRWKPAFTQARIFDTIFFLAEAAEGDWHPRPQPGECESAEWVSAAELLERIDGGTAHAIFPTKRNLERLARFGSIGEARADAAAFPLETITPQVETIDGKQHVTIPGGLGYPVTSEPLATAFRA
ncbi:NUDIX domain-containing protein [Sphingomonas sp. HDW15A]|uniref:NUDIX domain-containing protein n=1 Tax=Sphingomonas sp. HDW15A TaxID=2714942 RepID=UPI0014076334|nr:NUDIX domain-containing protein [Sphingomonas sp. HDW15A]QIK96373.1 NUDIX domain-containing protein [Sphingomonas sp. HDW15A]